MALNVNTAPKGNGGKKSDPVDIGNYAARIVQVIDLGLQPQRPYQGNEKAPAHELMLTYELGTEFLKDEEGNDDVTKPRWLSETFTLNHISKDMAKSTKRIKTIDPKNATGGDFSRVVNAPVTVTVVHKPKPDGGVYVNVGNVTPPMKGMAIPELVNSPKVFMLDEPDLEIFKSLPEWLQEKIQSNLNYNGSALQKALGGLPANAQHNEPVAQLSPRDVAEEEAPGLGSTNTQDGDIPW